MSIALLSLKYLSLSMTSVLLVSLLGSVIRQLAFLSVNVFFVGYLLGPVGAVSTIAFCLLGFALVKIHLKWPALRILYTLPLFVALFIYMRNYEALQWILPQEILTSVLGTVGLSFLFF